MDFGTFLALANRYEKLGWAVQEQLDNLLDGESVVDQNQNAVKLIDEFLAACREAGIEDADYA